MIYLIIIFIGYTIGRISHILGGHLNVPHHWIYGAIMLVFGDVVWSNFWGLAVALFGLGLLISDYNDFLEMKIYGRDEEGDKRFWGID